MTKDVELGPFKMVGPKGKQVKEFIEPKFTVTLGVLSGMDSFTVDDIVGPSMSDVKARKIYAVCAIKKINGTMYHPLEDTVQFEKTMAQFEGPQGLQRLNRLVTEFLIFVGEAANASDPKSSDSSSDRT